MENSLLEYMKKIQNMADYLARGGILEGRDHYTAIEIVSDELVKQRKAFSIQEYNLYDELETSFYGEQRSIGILIECIADGLYEEQIEENIDFSKEYMPEPEDAEFYNMVMKRIKGILKMMSLSLVSGSHIPLRSFEVYSLKECYLDEEELIENEDETVGVLVYHVEGDKFLLINPEGKVIIDGIDIHEAMQFYNEFLMEQEKDELERKIKEEIAKEEREQDEGERE